MLDPQKWLLEGIFKIVFLRLRSNDYRISIAAKKTQGQGKRLSIYIR